MIVSTEAFAKSMTFEFRGRCTGDDMVYSWGVNRGPPGEGKAPPPNQYGNAFMYPWIDQPVAIWAIGIAEAADTDLLSRMLGAPYIGYMMVGNDTDPDIMAMMGAGETSAFRPLPAGKFFNLPSRKNKTPLTYLDLHGTCSWPRKAHIFVNLYYDVIDEPR